jgi:3-hydroxyacyl-[acyl-carrier-protein] dehydratase
MLKDDFFTVKEEVASESGTVYRLHLAVSHPVFRAHFAGNPVVPGAFIAQMIKELAAASAGAAYVISSIRNMKFLRVISPLENPEISVRLVSTPPEGGHVSVSALIYDGDAVFSKAIIVLKPV